MVAQQSSGTHADPGIPAAHGHSLQVCETEGPIACLLDADQCEVLWMGSVMLGTVAQPAGKAKTGSAGGTCLASEQLCGGGECGGQHVDL